MYVRIEYLRSKLQDADENEKKTISDEIEKLLSHLIVIKKKDVEECKQFLDMSGIPYCNAPEDAEKYCTKKITLKTQ